MTTLITASLGYPELLADFRHIVRQEVANAFSTSPELSAAVGGIELAMGVTRLSKSRIYALVSARGIPHSKRGNKLYFSRTDLLAWVEEGKRTPHASR